MADWEGAVALVVVDVQKGFDDVSYWCERNNPDCERNVARLIAAWRARRWPIVFVRHDSVVPDSPLRSGSLGNEFKEVIDGEPDLLVTKSVHSAFLGEPNLDDWLRQHRIAGVVVCGIQTNMCCETTARQAGDLGYDLMFAIDATHTFDIVASDGRVHAADTIAEFTVLTLAADFGTVVSTAEIVDQVSGA
jgi:nicotinamidase-related amidase